LCGFFGCSTYYRIQKFDSNGSFLTAWGSAGSGKRVRGVSKTRLNGGSKA